MLTVSLLRWQCPQYAHGERIAVTVHIYVCVYVPRFFFGGAYSRRFVCPSVRAFVRPSVRPHVRGGGISIIFHFSQVYVSSNQELARYWIFDIGHSNVQYQFFFYIGHSNVQYQIYFDIGHSDVQNHFFLFLTFECPISNFFWYWTFGCPKSFFWFLTFECPISKCFWY